MTPCNHYGGHLCTRPRGHTGEHRATDEQGREYRWLDDETWIKRPLCGCPGGGK